MTEEEKSTFERLKSYYLQNARGNREIQKIFEPIFDLIIKQQKEIEELHIKLDDRETELQILKDDIKADEILYRSELIESYIHKQKIKDKIQKLKHDRIEYERQRMLTDYRIADREIEVLEEILEEE